MSSISDNLTQLRGQLPPEVLLVAVSKTKPLEDLQAAYDAGQRDFGENRVQEMAEKHAALPQDIRWHMIGHVQTNKIKDFVSWVHLVHGVDRLKVLEVLQAEAAKAG
ncbi:MAG: alanine racemase, partial [Schleiferiaceae bacterium]|nr:alanine racemase [Schleiferiaceae bacterium]